jgi:hypothetical protein
MQNQIILQVPEEEEEETRKKSRMLEALKILWQSVTTKVLNYTHPHTHTHTHTHTQYVYNSRGVEDFVAISDNKGRHSRRSLSLYIYICICVCVCVCVCIMYIKCSRC